MLVLSVGVREAARQMGLTEDAVRQWSSRGKWLEHITSPTPPGPKPASMVSVTTVTKLPADCLHDSIADDGHATKVAAMRYARRTMEHAQKIAEESPDEALAQAPNVKAVLGTAQIAGGWGADIKVNTQVNVLSTQNADAL